MTIRLAGTKVVHTFDFDAEPFITNDDERFEPVYGILQFDMQGDPEWFVFGRLCGPDGKPFKGDAPVEIFGPEWEGSDYTPLGRLCLRMRQYLGYDREE